MPIPILPSAERQASAKEKVYEQLAQWIIDGTLIPGEKLNESELAEYFSFSRTPVHEALMLLAEHHFVEIYPSRGSFVSPLSVEAADAIYEAISALNGLLTALACDKRTEDDLTRLMELNQKFDETQHRGDNSQVLAADNAFHLGVAAIAGNPYLLRYLRQLQMHVYRFEHVFARLAPDRSLSTQDHQAIIDAIERKDKETAAALAQANWMGTYTAQRDLLLQAAEEQAKQ